MIYTTNSIESLNYQMRKVIKNRGQFPNDAAAVKLLWLAICNIEDKRAAERAKERAQKRCRTAPDDSWKDRWSPTGRKHSNSSCWSTRPHRAIPVNTAGKQQRNKNQTTDLHKKLDTLAAWHDSAPTPPAGGNVSTATMNRCSPCPGWDRSPPPRCARSSVTGRVSPRRRRPPPTQESHPRPGRQGR